METKEIRKFLKTAVGKKVRITIGGKHFNPAPGAPIAFSKGNVLVGKLIAFNRIKDFVEMENAGFSMLDVEKVTLALPFYEIVLEKISQKIPCVLVSNGAEQEIRELGDILEGVNDIPDGAKPAIRKELCRLASMLSLDGDERWARSYLEGLAESFKS